jgi:glucose/arabinose dehydrogenase
VRKQSRVVGILVLLLAPSASVYSAPLDVEAEELRPGLVAAYRSPGNASASLDRIDIKPAFTLGTSSPHPRLPPGPFEVVWSGLLNLRERPPVSFEAFVCGEVTVEVDGVIVLRGRGQTETAHVGPAAPLDREPGLYRLKIRYTSLSVRPARLQIWWQGKGFSREPLPAWQLHHLAAEVPPSVLREELAEKGRVAVGQLGCARCHVAAFPGVAEPPPGPALDDLRGRLRRSWLLDWLADPARMRSNAHMPALFNANRSGFVERWLLVEHLLGPAVPDRPPTAGDHRLGRQAFISLGCAACHFLPDPDLSEQPDLGRTRLTGLGDRFAAGELAAFLVNPHSRYPDGRMPRLPVSTAMAKDIAAYLLLWSKPTRIDSAPLQPPTAEEIDAVCRRLGVRDSSAVGTALLRAKRCAACHPGLTPSTFDAVPLTEAGEDRGCLSGKSLPRYTLDTPTRKALAAYRTVASQDRHPSPFAARQRLLKHAGCVRCHQRDSDRPPPIEAAGVTLGGAMLQYVVYQRTPRLTYPHQKYTRAHLLAAIRDGVTGLRSAAYSYRMPAFGKEAEELVRALAEADGDLPDASDPTEGRPADPTLGPLAGSRLVGFSGYACVSCHVWNGKTLADSDPGAVGTDLTRVVGRIRRDWFDRYLEAPARSHPGTPMPAIFPKGEQASLQSVLDGDPARQKEALWGYFALGKEAPSPKPPPPLPVPAPLSGEPPLVAQIPLHLPDGTTVESICVLYASGDLLVYDLGAQTLHAGYTGAQILRDVQGRLRTFRAAGTAVGSGFRAETPLQLLGKGKPEVPRERILHGYDRLADGVRIRWQARFPSGVVEVAEALRLTTDRGRRLVLREFRFLGIPAGCCVELRSGVPGQARADVARSTASTKDAAAEAVLRCELPPPNAPPAAERTILADPGKIEGSLERPGYHAIAYPRPKTSSGEDRVMPSALAANPRDGRVFVASMKTGELFVVHDPTGDGRQARFDNYAGGFFQEAYSMLAEPDALYVLHRRNLTRITEAAGVAEHFDRVAVLPHGIADTYDYAYGLIRDRDGAFVFTFAPYANTHLPGSGGAVRLLPGKPLEEAAYGFRNPFGWCRGPRGEVFFTDNQGEWVATNKLCHLQEGRFFGFPNLAQRRHATRPAGKTAVWVPYGWARSINGVAYDDSGGKFGPFAGQFFLAELMFGGAIVRASLEEVNGQYQGACFPFWGAGLLGPLTLAFDPRGRLWVGSITEPGWMAQPDRGALYRIDFTGVVPFEIKSIHVLPRGFRLVFTAPVSPATARELASYRIEHYRYEYTGAYGSPELDRTPLAVERMELSPDGRSVDLTTAPLVKDRVYLIAARGVRSAGGEALVHPAGAYTLNEVPDAKP